MSSPVHRQRLRGLVWVLAVSYPAALVGVLLAFRLVGERWAPTAVLLYLPRVGFGLPLPALAIAALVLKERWLAAPLGLAAWLLVFPVMGLHLSLPRGAPHGPSIHVFSCNVSNGRFGLDRVMALVRRENPDIVLLQEAYSSQGVFEASLADYDVRISNQFVLASRFHVASVYEPPKIATAATLRSPRIVGYELETPLGLLSLHHVHPISPREGFYAVRGHGLRHELLSGHVFAGEWVDTVAQNTTLRSLQLGAVAAKAGERRERVLLVGDTNLPEGSRLLHELFGGYVDGFASVGNGFGYTFPADRRPWMRIDRMLASPDLAFSSFSTLTDKVSDHLCIAARIGAR